MYFFMKMITTDFLKTAMLSGVGQRNAGRVSFMKPIWEIVAKAGKLSAASASHHRRGAKRPLIAELACDDTVGKNSKSRKRLRTWCIRNFAAVPLSFQKVSWSPTSRKAFLKVRG